MGEPAQSVATLNRVDMKRFRALMSDTSIMVMNRLKQETKGNETTTAREGEKERKLCYEENIFQPRSTAENRGGERST